MHIKHLFWALCFLFSSASWAAQPDVYTGVLTYANTSRVMLTRIFLIPRSDSNIPDIHMNQYLGGFDSNEVTPTYFDRVSLQSDGTYVLSDKRSQDDNVPSRVPTIFLKKTAAGGFEGDYISIEDGIAGTVSLVKGWSIPDEMTKGKKISPSLEGDYMANCSGFQNSKVVQVMELVATRFESKDMALIPGADTTIKAVNYLGALSCAPSKFPNSVETSCGAFDRGNFDHYKNQLNLHVALNWQYSCEITDDGDLNCQGPKRETCEFLRFRNERDHPLDVVGSAPTFSLPLANPTSVEEEPATAPVSPIDCSGLNGVTSGILRHGLTGLYQRVKLEARAVESQSNGEQGCQLVGSIRQYFDKADERTIFPLTHVLSTSWFSPTTGVGRIGASRVGGDAQIILSRVGNEWRGHWFSRLFGYVGEVVFSKSPSLIEPKGEDEYVRSLSGVFTQQPQHGIDVKRVVSIIGYPDTSDTNSFDPVRQIKLSGNLETTAYDGNGDPGMQTTAGLDSITYNYFTGVATFIGPSAYYYAKMGPLGLVVKVIIKRWGGNYMPVTWTWDFVRG